MINLSLTKFFGDLSRFYRKNSRVLLNEIQEEYWMKIYNKDKIVWKFIPNSTISNDKVGIKRWLIFKAIRISFDWEVYTQFRIR